MRRVMCKSKVHRATVTEANLRFETYVIEGEPGSGAVVLNGAAARLVQPGDKVVVISYAAYEEAELEAFRPRLVFVDEHNRIVENGGGGLRVG